MEDIDFLTEKINDETPEYGNAYPFAIFVRDKEIIAGCNGSIIYGTIYTDQLWVHPDYRSRGLGKELMEKVHAYGKQEGCALATVATMSFQAAHFYQKLGYIEDFARPGYVKNSSCLFFSKSLK